MSIRLKNKDIMHNNISLLQIAIILFRTTILTIVLGVLSPNSLATPLPQNEMVLVDLEDPKALVPVLGNGFDTVKGSLRGKFIDSNSFGRPNPRISTDVEIELDDEESSVRSSRTRYLNASYKGFGAQIAAEVRRNVESKSRTRSLRIFVNYDVSVSEQGLEVISIVAPSDLVSKLGQGAKERAQFVERFGDSYVSSVRYGARLICVVSIQSDSATRLESFKAALRGSGWGGKIDAGFISALDSSDKSLRIKTHYKVEGVVLDDFPPQPTGDMSKQIADIATVQKNFTGKIKELVNTQRQTELRVIAFSLSPSDALVGLQPATFFGDVVDKAEAVVRGETVAALLAQSQELLDDYQLMPYLYKSSAVTQVEYLAQLRALDLQLIYRLTHIERQDTNKLEGECVRAQKWLASLPVLLADDPEPYKWLMDLQSAKDADVKDAFIPSLKRLIERAKDVGDVNLSSRYPRGDSFRMQLSRTNGIPGGERTRTTFLELLDEARAWGEQRHADGMSQIHWAIADQPNQSLTRADWGRGLPELRKRLCAGASPNVTAWEYRAAAQIPAINNAARDRADMVRLLLQFGADAQAFDPMRFSNDSRGKAIDDPTATGGGNSPLLEAAIYATRENDWNLDVARVLVAHGASFSKLIRNRPNLNSILPYVGQSSVPQSEREEGIALWRRELGAE